MRNLFFLLLIFLFFSCAVSNNGIVNEYNIALHDDPIKIYNNYSTRYSFATIPPNVNFRVRKNASSKKNNNRRKIYYDGHFYWVIVLVFKYEKDYTTWSNEQKEIEIIAPAIISTSSSSNTNHNYHTGPRGGQYYINSKGNKVYKKKK
jgi:hypothetical protein